MLRKILGLVLVLTLVTCNDGDFEVPSFEFNTTINSCGDYVLYRVNSSKTEALILKLSSTQLPDTITSVSKKIPIKNDNLIYRIFSDEIGSDYFCQDVPPLMPEVREEWTGVSGSNNIIEINTVFNINTSQDTIGYTHEIMLKNLILENGNDKMTFVTYNFGTFDVNY